VIARALLAIGVLWSGPMVGAQSAEDVYMRLLRLYPDRPALAAESVAKLSGDVINRGIQVCRDGRCSLPQLRAAAMMHADAADIVIGPIGYKARDQIRFGRELLEIAGNVALNNRALEYEVKALELFGGRWYALTSRLLLAHGHFEIARLVVTEGRVHYPNSPDLFVLLGLLNEWRGGLGLDSGDLRGFIVRGELFDRGFGSAGPGAVPYRGNASREVQVASEDYRRAIDLDPAHAGARLRLAWAHLLLADRRVWEDLPVEFIQKTNPEARYLAHLLRGTSAEREQNATSALAEYEAARAAAPDSQTACLAVSSAQALNGRMGESRRTAVECLDPGLGALEVDAWTVFRIGLMDLTTTTAMRDEARRQ
jgi:tetratricopeptide (TPR) repeat protein